jgi:hypothetical protein
MDAAPGMDVPGEGPSPPKKGEWGEIVPPVPGKCSFFAPLRLRVKTICVHPNPSVASICFQFFSFSVPPAFAGGFGGQARVFA